MKLKILSFYLLLNTLSCAQELDSKLLGSWYLESDYEHPDIIIFRSDNKYFVYNSNNVETESIGKDGELLSDDIRIGEAYTSLTESGQWRIDSKKKKLILEQRELLEQFADFSNAYGKKDKLNFDLKLDDGEILEVCLQKESEKICDTYKRNWSYNDEKGRKVFYKEQKEEFTGVGNKNYEIKLSGYERQIDLVYDFFKEPDQLTILDQNGRVIISTEMKATEGRKRKRIQLRGTTKLKFKVNSSESSSKWRLKLSVF